MIFLLSFHRVALLIHIGS
jgi:hypothetical protein